MSELLKVKDLKTYFYGEEKISRAVDGMNFHLDSRETLGLVGESGCGKSLTALSILRLVPEPPGKIVSGEIIFEGRDLLKLSEKEMRHVRGRQISMIFQEPMTSLNPVFTIEYQIAEMFLTHTKMTKKEAREKVVELLDQVKIPAPRERVKDYPHQLSGGMRQRVMIAMALACQPKIVIADEPTTALDVTIQAQILDLFLELKTNVKMSLIMITHDLGVIAEIADRVAIMYAGEIVEEAPVKDLFSHPLHPYTIGLLKCVPRIGETQQQLQTIGGTVPDPSEKPKGCPFHPRCFKAQKKCETDKPEMRELESGHWAACHFPGE